MQDVVPAASSPSVSLAYTGADPLPLALVGAALLIGAESVRRLLRRRVRS